MGILTYQIGIKCLNCGCNNKLSVRKGIAADEFVKSTKCKCKECGCKINPTEYTTQWIK